MRIWARITASLGLLCIAAVGLLGVSPHQRTIFYGQTTSTGGGGGGATPAFVNGSVGICDSSCASTASSAVSLTAGNFEVACITQPVGYDVWLQPANGGSLNDTAGNNLVTNQIGSWQTDSSSTYETSCFYKANVAGNASNVVTVHYGASPGHVRLVIVQYSGANATTPLDSASVTQGTCASAATCTTSAMTIAQANTLVIVYSSVNNATATNSVSLNSISLTMREDDLGSSFYRSSLWDAGFASTFTSQTAVITPASSQIVTYVMFGFHA